MHVKKKNRKIRQSYNNRIWSHCYFNKSIIISSAHGRFFYKLESSDEKYQTNGTVRYESYKGNLLFPMKDFWTFGIYCRSVFFMSNIFLKYNIGGVRVPQFKLAYIINTTYPSHKKLVRFCRAVHYMCNQWWQDGN